MTEYPNAKMVPLDPKAYNTLTEHLEDLDKRIVELEVKLKIYKETLQKLYDTSYEILKEPATIDEWGAFNTAVAEAGDVLEED